MWSSYVAAEMCFPQSVVPHMQPYVGPKGTKSPPTGGDGIKAAIAWETKWSCIKMKEPVKLPAGGA